MDFNFKPNPLKDTTSELICEVAKNTEVEILKQLNEFISRGLLVWQQSNAILINEGGISPTLKISYTGKLVLKDQEYIEKLEKENEKLTKIISDIKNINLD